ncbi:hypothetical protein ISF_09990 [Cordyceps fumosorosea ARSEF 2679]|uniref:Uncharacterized protein n=1 Tax=Cordyceps fumosorosea (strain ARSEF 2679) TaxID=1081104 RepID=A0A166WVC6_CORFA|nr:hypothetical protein ISF_09990 [Cordyceps fumosorosea ARSEF 2679]OAA35142.1 hypothetical protein ISF_09990 [Cordyceps fumosorosea ARSEF 2679]
MVATIYTARFHEDFPRFQREYGDLTDKDLQASASNCKAAHLPYLRLVVRNQSNDPEILPIFANDHAAACPRCHPAHSPQHLHQDRLDYVMQHISMKSLLRKSRTELDDMPCAEFWTTLAECIRPGHPPLTKSYTFRPQNSSKLSQYYVNTLTAIQTDSSSPPMPPSSSEYSADYELDEDAFINLCNVPESLTNHLAYMTDRYALYCLQQQDPDAEIRARLNSVRYTARIGPATITSWDDGGLARYERQPDGWFIANPSIAIRESKIASTSVAYDPTTADINPVITNETLAQYLVEAVTAMRANPPYMQTQYSLPALPRQPDPLTRPSASF